MRMTRREFLAVAGTGAVAASIEQALYSRPASAQLKTVKIGTAVLGDFGFVAPIAVAMEKGYFKENGIAVEFTPFRGGPPLLQAVQAGQIHIGITGATDVPVFREKVPVRYVAATVTQNHFTLNTALGVTKLEDLRGKSIGVTASGATTWVFANILAKQQGWVPDKDLKIVPLGPVDAQYAALARGEIHAIVWGDAGAVYEHEGKSKILMPLASITPKWISEAAYCTDEYIKTNKDDIRRALRAYFQGVKFIRENQVEAVKIAAKALTWPEPATVKAYQLTTPLYAPDGRIDLEALRFMQNTLLEYNVIKQRLPLEDYYTNEFTPVRL